MPRLHRGAEVMLDRPITRPVALARNVTARRHPVHPGRVSPAGAVRHRDQCALSRSSSSGSSRSWLTPSGTAAARSRRCALALARRQNADRRHHAARLPRPGASGPGQLVSEGLADILAGDNHGDDRTVATGAQFLWAQDGFDQVDLLAATESRRHSRGRRAHPGAAAPHSPELDQPDQTVSGGGQVSRTRIDAGLDAAGADRPGIEGPERQSGRRRRPVRGGAARRVARSTSAETAAAPPMPSISRPSTSCATPSTAGPSPRWPSPPIPRS